ncbi:hypothetical protein PT974_04985 [Cladobotryum mycophilum]|uniref:Uncharacterized protein n=1 Tax=Cladobotryum mycophilum TaxID=491253 RepID=A0ABR0SQW0_9HYPO
MNVIQTEIHNGSLDELLPNASPGLLFLKEFLTRYDSLGPFIKDATPELERLCSADTFFEVNNEKVPASQKIGMIKVRAQSGGVSRIVRSIVQSKDNLLANNCRMVSFETVTTTIFQNDPPGVSVTAKEINFLTIEPCTDPLRSFKGYRIFGMITTRLP